MNPTNRMDLTTRIIEATKTMILGTVTIGIITREAVKDHVAIAVGIVTIVCLIFSTFFKKEKKRK